jgi:putative FmdB family regulatory protein
MPVYEYECKECDRIFEVQQKMADEPLRHCPKCQAPIKKLMSMSSFQLRGGGWYADGYSSASAAAKSDAAAVKSDAVAKSDTAVKPATPCPAGGSCAGCPATASA